jgi:lipopolysaccharide export system permease protein
MKKLIFRKITKDTLAFFLLTCFTIGLIVWIMQAVNYLDYVTQDGHGLKTYFLYTLYNFPKIIHRIIPFIFFISLFFVLISYELKNELLIFWTHGISKIKFAHKIIILSVFLLLFQIFIGSFVSPLFQYKARTFLKNSDINFFTTLIKEGKFINIVEGLTIFIERKEENNSFSNIFIDDSSKIQKKMIYAKNGIIIDQGDQKIFRLFEGKVLNKEKLKVNIFEFEQIDFSLSDYSTNTIIAPKIQEIPSRQLFTCTISLYKKKINVKKKYDFSCDLSILEEINQELLKRFYKPLYIPVVALICCYLILFPKNSIKFSGNKKNTFLIGFFIMIISETSLRYATISHETLFFYLFAPWLIFLTAYILFYNKVKNV